MFCFWCLGGKDTVTPPQRLCFLPWRWFMSRIIKPHRLNRAPTGCLSLQLTRAHSLVVEHYVRKPDVLGRYPKFLDAFILLWVPSEPVVIPLLQRRWETRAGRTHPHTAHSISRKLPCLCTGLPETSHLTWNSHKLVVMICSRSFCRKTTVS